MKDYADKDWLHPPKLDAGDAFVALCVILCVAYILYRGGIWA